jgi:hypothetical protein
MGQCVRVVLLLRRALLKIAPASAMLRVPVALGVEGAVVPPAHLVVAKNLDHPREFLGVVIESFHHVGFGAKEGKR